MTMGEIVAVLPKVRIDFDSPEATQRIAEQLTAAGWDSSEMHIEAGSDETPFVISGPISLAKIAPGFTATFNITNIEEDIRITDVNGDTLTVITSDKLDIYDDGQKVRAALASAGWESEGDWVNDDESQYWTILSGYVHRITP